MPTEDKKSCERMKCPVENQAIDEDGNCYFCPEGEGLVKSTRRCANCKNVDCTFCTLDYQKCLVTKDVERIVTNAGGHIGNTTFTLTWKDKYDLDLKF